MSRLITWCELTEGSKLGNKMTYSQDMTIESVVTVTFWNILFFASDGSSDYCSVILLLLLRLRKCIGHTKISLVTLETDSTLEQAVTKNLGWL